MECSNCKILVPKGTEVCPSCGQSPVRKKYCFLVKVLIFMWIILIVGVYLSVHLDTKDVEPFMIIGACIILFISPFIAIAALIRISLKSRRLRGRGVSILILLFSSYMMLGSVFYTVPRGRFSPHIKTVCRANIKMMGQAFQIYAYEHEDKLISDNWCDILIDELDVSPMQLRCWNSEIVTGESDYCLNKYAMGKKFSELPKDMVLMFEAEYIPGADEKRLPIRNREHFQKSKRIGEYMDGSEEVYLGRWNRIGGPELVDLERHEDECNVLFTGGEARSIKNSELPQFKWSVDNESEVSRKTLADKIEGCIEEPYLMTYQKILLVSFGFSGLILTVWSAVKYNACQHLGFVCAVGFMSASTGWLFGNMSEFVYLDSPFLYAGDISGTFFGLVVGICYAAVASSYWDKLRQIELFKTFFTSIGMLVGVLCSTLVHAALMITYVESNPFGLVMGIPFGIFAGAIMGLVSGLILLGFDYPMGKNEVTKIEVKREAS